ncbi:MAG: helix-turn-helix domain-containing protein [Clostridia bacterium]|nr:helix-turn-helix domain-containing protein [Clostridia bacterium]
MDVSNKIKLDNIRLNIIEAIKCSGLTQSHLASILGVSQQTISYYLKGEKLPALDTLANLCLILELDANDILGISDKRSK